MPRYSDNEVRQTSALTGVLGAYSGDVYGQTSMVSRGILFSHENTSGQKIIKLESSVSESTLGYKVGDNKIGNEVTTANRFTKDYQKEETPLTVLEACCL